MRKVSMSLTGLRSRGLRATSSDGNTFQNTPVHGDSPAQILTVIRENWLLWIHLRSDESVFGVSRVLCEATQGESG